MQFFVLFAWSENDQFKSFSSKESNIWKLFQDSKSTSSNPFNRDVKYTATDDPDHYDVNYTVSDHLNYDGVNFTTSDDLDYYDVNYRKSDDPDNSGIDKMAFDGSPADYDYYKGLSLLDGF